MYLLTLQIQEDGKTYLTNEIIDVSPEIWLSRKLKYMNDNYIVVITNCIGLRDANQIAVRNIEMSNYEIELRS